MYAIRSYYVTCATLLMMDKVTQERFVTQMYWLPRDSFEKRVQQDKIPYDKWLDRGLLRLCNGNSINYGDVTAWFMEMVQVCGITPAWIYYDSYSAKYWVEEMENRITSYNVCYTKLLRSTYTK